MEDTQLITPTDNQNITAMMAMAQVKNSLDKATLEYGTKLKEYAISISQLKEQIKVQEQKTNTYRVKFDNIAQDIEYETRLLKRLNDSFVKKAEMIEEFNVEFEGKIEKTEYDKLHKRKLKDMIQLEDEIEEVEQTLLEKELDRLNILSDLEPFNATLEEMRAKLLALELEKEHFESLQIHNLSNITNQTQDIKDVEVVDVESSE
jgi:cupin superfamily acireductone dioxygenase involved in methionine salvage